MRNERIRCYFPVTAVSWSLSAIFWHVNIGMVTGLYPYRETGPWYKTAAKPKEISLPFLIYSKFFIPKWVTVFSPIHTVAVFIKWPNKRVMQSPSLWKTWAQIIANLTSARSTWENWVRHHVLERPWLESGCPAKMQLRRTQLIEHFQFFAVSWTEDVRPSECVLYIAADDITIRLTRIEAHKLSSVHLTYTFQWKTILFLISSPDSHKAVISHVEWSCIAYLDVKYAGWIWRFLRLYNLLPFHQ
jgi:hypothetical protein